MSEKSENRLIYVVRKAWLDEPGSGQQLQEYDLYFQFSIAGNILFGLKALKVEVGSSIRNSKALSSWKQENLEGENFQTETFPITRITGRSQWLLTPTPTKLIENVKIIQHTAR